MARVLSGLAKPIDDRRAVRVLIFDDRSVQIEGYTDFECRGVRLSYEAAGAVLLMLERLIAQAQAQEQEWALAT